MTKFIDTAQKICSNEALDRETCLELAQTPNDQIFQLMAGADIIRKHHYGTGVNLCAINNAKSGKCSEDCRFCAQSGAYDTDIETYPLKAGKELFQAMETMAPTPLHRYSAVTSGRGLSSAEVSSIADVMARGKDFPQSYCASLGILKKEDFETLKAAGVSRYHHNLETSRSHFDKICTTHTYEQRIQTIKLAKKAGMSICSGGIFGIGETMDQVVELAMDLKALDVDAVPVNFLTPVQGTPLMDQPGLSPLECLKIISLFRYILPEKEILICGGRMVNLKTLHPMVFFAGASGIMTGSYLTTSGNQMDDDLEMITQLGFEPRN